MIATDMQQAKAVKKRNEARICDLLKWLPLTYAHFMYNSGLQYLALYTSNDDDVVRIISAQEGFWDWWKRLFLARDDAYVDEWDGLEDVVTLVDRRQLYRDIHNPHILVAEIHPPSAIYPKDFAIIKMEMK